MMKANMIELDRLNKETFKDQAHIAEDEEALERFFEDADESRANPNWLR